MTKLSNINDDAILEKLIGLGDFVNLTIKQSLEKKELFPNKEQYIKWKVDKFEYTDNGIEVGSSTGEYITKDDWGSHAIFISHQFEQKDNVKEILEFIQKKYNEHGKYLFQNLIYEISLQSLQNTFSDSILRKIVENFLKILKNESREFNLDSELVGIILHSKILRISDSISLRQTTREDLEKEVKQRDNDRYGFFPTPTAFLQIKIKTNNQNELENKKRQILKIFKLFKVASVKYLKSRIFSEVPVVTGFGTIHSGDQTHALETIVIKKEDEQNLQKFTHKLENYVSADFGTPNHDMSFGEIAFSRYEEALMKQNSVESRISDTMMGLESVYLVENAELSYRLRLRISKIMGYFGFDPHEISRLLVDAYEIRSQFVHGGLMKFKHREKLEAKYGNIDNLMKTLFDILRISIVITLLMNVGKEEFLSKLDKSFIDIKSEGGVNQIVSPAKQALGIN